MNNNQITAIPITNNNNYNHNVQEKEVDEGKNSF